MSCDSLPVGTGRGVNVRGVDVRTGELFSYIDLEARVRSDHPLRPIRIIVNEALAALEGEFAALYARVGRPSIPPEIPPEKLLRAMLLQAFYSIRSERQLMERPSTPPPPIRMRGSTARDPARRPSCASWLTP